VARMLVDEPIATYTGFDRHLGMIQWCRQEIATRDDRFAFYHYDLKSAYDNFDGQEGTIDAADFCFPFPDEAFDTILLASVFTHMPLNETAHYLKELHRVLRPQGKIIASIFFTQEEPYAQGMDFYYRPKDFRQAFRKAALYRRGRDLIKSVVRPNLVFGNRHNWVVLTKRRVWR
jgi:SAM-dependent methyltransferase